MRDIKQILENKIYKYGDEVYYNKELQTKESIINNEILTKIILAFFSPTESYADIIDDEMICDKYYYRENYKKKQIFLYSRKKKIRINRI